MKQKILSLFLGVAIFTPMAGDLSVCAQAPIVQTEPVLLSLDKAISEMNKQLTVYSQSLPAAEQTRLTSLLDKQKQQLEAVKGKYSKEKNPPTKKQLMKDLAQLFATGEDLRKALQPPKGIVKPTEYSADPSQCARHCYETCGYNSLGEKVCWYTCYYCCGQGGC